MTRTLAAFAAALLATGARAQTPPPAAAPPAEAPKTVEVKKVDKGTYVIGEKSQISLNGRAWASLENVSASYGQGAATAHIQPRWRLQNNSSYLRVRGETEVAYGIKAIAQIEAEFGIDGEAGSPFSGTRNTGVGLRHKQFGTLIAGRWDTPMKVTTIGLDPFGGTGIHGYYNTFGSQFTSVGGASSNRWDRRANNSLNYTSPTIMGLTVLANGSVGETRLSGLVPVDPYTASVAVHYRNGPLYVGAAYEFRHDCGNPDADGGAATPSCNTSALGSANQPKGEDSGFRLGVGFTNKPTFTKVGAAFEYIDLKTFQRAPNAATGVAAAAHRSANRSGYWAALTQGLGTDKLEASLIWGMADQWHGTVFQNVKHTGGQYYTVALRHWLSKDVDITAAVTLVENESNATYRFGSNNVGAVARGADSLGYGVNYRFIF